jgi:hypothetical protein
MKKTSVVTQCGTLKDKPARIEKERSLHVPAVRGQIELRIDGLVPRSVGRGSGCRTIFLKLILVVLQFFSGLDISVFNKNSHAKAELLILPSRENTEKESSN